MEHRQKSAVAAVLTYHRIVPEGTREFFHDIEEPAFTAQLCRVCQRTTSAADGFRLISGCGRLCFTFDDGTSDHRRAAELLSSLGLVGTFFVITGKLGAPGYLSETDVRTMAGDGHRLASHAVTHRHLTSLSAQELAEELVSSRRQLQEISRQPVDWLAPPGGVYSAAVIAAALRAGYRVIRTMDWGYAAYPLGAQVPCLPVIAHYDLARFDRLLDGRAPLWLHAVKNLLKRSVGPAAYTRLRNYGSRLISR